MKVMLSRRKFLRLLTLSSGLLCPLPSIALAGSHSDTKKRFIFIIQRGAVDGLHTVIPYAEPAYANLRGALALDSSKITKLDSLFALHGELATIAKLYADNQALFVHAVASPYRDRSHFDGQNVLETGGNSPFHLNNGWMNRLLTLLPTKQNQAIAIAQKLPLALNGDVKVASFWPTWMPKAPDNQLMQIAEMYEQDPQLHAIWMSAMDARGMLGELGAKHTPSDLGKLIARLLVRADGPRIAMIGTEGWDTHTGQIGQLANQFRSLDQLLAALHKHMGDKWQQTTIVVATEFGRTVAANGTGGTDHGTASSAMILGGDVKGGRVIADWPGLANSNLFEGRDLKPTTNLFTLLASLIGASFAVDPEKVNNVLFPENQDKKIVEGLLRSS